MCPAVLSFNSGLSWAVYYRTIGDLVQRVRQEKTKRNKTKQNKTVSIITCSVPVIYTTGNIRQRKWMKPIRDRNYLHRKDTFVSFFSLIELHYNFPVDLTPFTIKHNGINFNLIPANSFRNNWTIFQSNVSTVKDQISSNCFDFLLFFDLSQLFF